MTERIALLFFAFLTAGCGPEKRAEQVPLRVRVVGEQERPLSGVPVSLDGKRLGTTDAAGGLHAAVAGPEGRRHRVTALCPENSIAEPGDTAEIEVRFLRPVGRDDGSWVPIEIGFTCLSRLRKSVLVIRADGQARLPVLAFGRPIAVTDDQGLAQTVIEGAAGEEVELILDTSGRPELRPQMPARRLTFPPAGRIFVFDQRFSLKRPDGQGTRRRHAGPRRI